MLFIVNVNRVSFEEIRRQEQKMDKGNYSDTPNKVSVSYI